MISAPVTSMSPLRKAPVSPIAMPRQRPLAIAQDPSCVLYYSMLDRLSSVKMVDESGGKTNGTISGGSMWKPNGLGFNGSDSKVTIPYNANIDILKNNGGFTFLIGVTPDKLPSVKGNDYYFLDQADGAGTGRPWLMAHKEDGTPGTYLKDELVSHIGGYTFLSGQILEVGKPTFFAFAVDAYSAALLGLDEGATGDYTLCANSALTEFAEATIDSVEFFNREFTSHEVENMRQYHNALMR